MGPQNTYVYIDAVKQLMCIYKQLDHAGAKNWDFSSESQKDTGNT